MSHDPHTFVLIHGAWHGGWCWVKVARRLRALGHDVYTPSLTGLGDRAHLLSREITLETHIADVTSLIESEELERVTLVGHSYAGMVVTAVADRMRQRLQSVVFVDAVVPKPGESWSSTHSRETIAARIAAAEQSSAGVSLPVPSADAMGIHDADDAARANRRFTPHPFGTYQSPLHFSLPVGGGLPRVFVDCINPPLATIAASRQRVRTERGWIIHELATGHDPMITEPASLTALLLAAASL